MSVFDVLFPRFCLGCGYVGCYFCSSCKSKLKPVQKDACIYCGKGSFTGLTHPGCVREYGVGAFLASYHYNTTIQRVIKGIKYRGVEGGMKDLLLTTGQMIAEKLYPLTKLHPTLVIQPVPLYATRQQERGFNQAALLSHFLSFLLCLPEAHFLERTINTRPQAEQATKKQRRKNLSRSMRVLSGKITTPILLVDDVVTSGATTKEAARVLRAAGAPFVGVFALAKG